MSLGFLINPLRLDKLAEFPDDHVQEYAEVLCRVSEVRRADLAHFPTKYDNPLSVEMGRKADASIAIIPALPLASTSAVTDEEGLPNEKKLVLS